MSPYLFVLSMEVFSQLLIRAVVAGQVAFHPKCLRVSLSHLCFADNLMIFTEATQSSLQGVRGVLNDFYSLSGLQVRYKKCKVFCSGLSQEAQVQLAKDFGIHLGRLPV